MEKEDLKIELEKLEAEMNSADFWTNKDKAQATLKKIKELQAEIAGVGKYDAGDAVVTIFSGAGGDDSEDFSAILLNMYLKYFSKNNFSVTLLHENQNDHGGYRNVTIEIGNPASHKATQGQGAYGTLKMNQGFTG